MTNPAGLYLGVLEKRPLFHPDPAHLLTVAPSGAGKGTSVVIPNLLHYPGSAFVTDPKGELACVTRQHRGNQFGHDIFVINPWGLHGLPDHKMNPLGALPAMARDEARAKDLIDDVKSLALQLLPEGDAEDKNTYFRNGGRKILRAILLYLAARKDPARCTLPEAWRILSSIGRLKETVAAMIDRSDIGDDVVDSVKEALADRAETLSDHISTNDEQFADFRENAIQVLDIFEPAGWLGQAVDSSDVSFADLKTGRTTIYLVIPQERVATHGAWLGMLTHRAINEVSRHPGRGSVLFLLDEFANMGRLSALAQSLTALRGMGVKLWLFVQEMADIERIYGKNLASTVFSQAEVKQFFQIENDDMAERISKILGQMTVKINNFGMGEREDKEPDMSVQETGRPLMTPDEIRVMPRDEQLVVVSGMHPIRAKRVPYWAVAPWRKQAEDNPMEGTPPQPRTAVTVPAYD